MTMTLSIVTPNNPKIFSPQIERILGLLDPVLSQKISSLEALAIASSEDLLQERFENLLKELAHIFTVRIDFLRHPLGFAAAEYDHCNRTLESELQSVKFQKRVMDELFLVHPDARTGEIKARLELLTPQQCLEGGKGVLAGMDDLGYRPAILAELLAFGSEFPTVQKSFDISALGTQIYQSVAYLSSCRSGAHNRSRELFLGHIDVHLNPPKGARAMLIRSDSPLRYLAAAKA